MASDPPLDPRHQPAPGRDVEAILGRHTAARVLVVGPAMVIAFWLIRGAGAGFAAAIGVAIVAANFVLFGVVLSRAAGISLQFYRFAALFGFLIRLGLIMAAFFFVAWLFEVDRFAMGVAAVVAYLVLLSLESWAVLRGARRELEWTS